MMPDSVIGHRGARLLYPENSLEGFGALRGDGVRAVECDVRLTKDEVLVCSHDLNLKRLGGPDRAIREMTGDEIGQVVLRTGVGVPTLGDVLDRLEGAVGIVIELKNDERDCRRGADLVAGLLEVRRIEGKRDEIRAVSSFDEGSAARFREVSRHFGPKAALLSRRNDSVKATLDRAAGLGIGQIHPHVFSVLGAARAVERSAAEGVEVTCWTVNSVSIARRLLGLGVAAIITDDPVRVGSALELGAR
jgi:glycerophosphoryl diester phosphodiesterase